MLGLAAGDVNPHVQLAELGFVGGEPIVSRFESLSELPARTPLAEALSKDLKARGFGLVGPTIVYVTFQRTAEEVAAFLSKNGLEAKAYHAGMNSDDRNAVQNAFMDSGHMVIVATIAFGMGVDKADIRYVYHYNLPKSLESYSQEIGRAGRDAKSSTCELLACADDVVVLENFTYGDTPGPESVVSFVRDVLGRGDAFDISIYELSNAHDIRPLVVKTLLTYLELQDVIAQSLYRLDVIPAGLVLGQAAYESGYGTSRFAAEGNALFGQRHLQLRHVPQI